MLCSLLPTGPAAFRPIPEARRIERRSADSLSEESFRDRYLKPGKPVIITGEALPCGFAYHRRPARNASACKGRPAGMCFAIHLAGVHRLPAALQSTCDGSVEARGFCCAGALAGWPACAQWPQLGWWSCTHGHRSVPVEFGRSGRPEWREEVLPLGRFVAEHLAPSAHRRPHPESDASTAAAPDGRAPGGAAEEAAGSAGGGGVAYLAQHPLLVQLPSLAADIRVPALCGPAGARITNVWLGTGALKTCVCIKLPACCSPSGRGAAIHAECTNVGVRAVLQAAP